MSIIDAILLGLLQGLTEFIPVSSSGHLILLDEYTSVESSFAFDVLINIGTLLALIVYFRRRLVEIARQVFKNKDRQLLLNIIFSTIPAVIVGSLLIDTFSSDSVRSQNIVIFMLISVGALMVAADLLLKGKNRLEQLNLNNAWWIGLAQALALIPGTSRSGATILAGRAFKLSYAQAAEYSFLIAIPILFGAIGRSMLEAETIQTLQADTIPTAVGITTAFISGWLAIDFMLKILRRRGLIGFGLYRIVLALALIFIGS